MIVGKINRKSLNSFLKADILTGPRVFLHNVPGSTGTATCGSLDNRRFAKRNLAEVLAVRSSDSTWLQKESLGNLTLAYT